MNWYHHLDRTDGRQFHKFIVNSMMRNTKKWPFFYLCFVLDLIAMTVRYTRYYFPSILAFCARLLRINCLLYAFYYCFYRMIFYLYYVLVQLCQYLLRLIFLRALFVAVEQRISFCVQNSLQLRSIQHAAEARITNRQKGTNRIKSDQWHKPSNENQNNSVYIVCCHWVRFFVLCLDSTWFPWHRNVEMFHTKYTYKQNFRYTSSLELSLLTILSHVCSVSLASSLTASVIRPFWQWVWWKHSRANL